MRTDRLSACRVFIKQLLPLVLWLGLFAAPIQAADLPPGSSISPKVLASMPTALQPWIDWVLHDRPDRRCPVNYDAVDQRQCVWPSALKLDLDARGGEFS